MASKQPLYKQEFKHRQSITSNISGAYKIRVAIELNELIQAVFKIELAFSRCSIIITTTTNTIDSQYMFFELKKYCPASLL